MIGHRHESQTPVPQNAHDETLSVTLRDITKMWLVSDELSGGSHSPIANRSIYISESAGPALHVPSSAEFGDDCNWLMETKAVFYHAGCPVCVDAEQNIAQALDRNRFDIEIHSPG
jgi:hypothetical protein